MRDDFLVNADNADWAIRSTYHIALIYMHDATVFGRDILFDIPYIVDWTAI